MAAAQMQIVRLRSVAHMALSMLVSDTDHGLPEQAKWRVQTGNKNKAWTASRAFEAVARAEASQTHRYNAACSRRRCVLCQITSSFKSLLAGSRSKRKEGRTCAKLESRAQITSSRPNSRKHLVLNVSSSDPRGSSFERVCKHCM